MGPHDRKIWRSTPMPGGKFFDRYPFPSAKSGVPFDVRVKTWVKFWHANQLSDYINAKTGARAYRCAVCGDFHAVHTKLDRKIQRLQAELDAMCRACRA